MSEKNNKKRESSVQKDRPVIENIVALYKCKVCGGIVTKKTPPGTKINDLLSGGINAPGKLLHLCLVCTKCGVVLSKKMVADECCLSCKTPVNTPVLPKNQTVYGIAELYQVVKIG